MNGPRDDDYDSLRDLMGGNDDDSDPESGRGDPSGTASDEEGEGLDLPPGLPPEYAEAYRAGYERARHEEEPNQPEEPTVGFDEGPDTSGFHDAGRSGDAEATAAIPVVDEPLSPPAGQESSMYQAPGHEPTQQIEVGQVPPPVAPSRAPAAPAYDEPEEDEGRRIPFLPALLVLAVILVVAAFGVGRLLADNAAESGNEAGGSGGPGGSVGQNGPYQGAVQAATIAGASASCEAPSSVDAAGNPTTYEPANAYDRDLTTAWRCGGSGKGQTLTITLPADTQIAEVGLVPGYAKTDPVSGADRYAQNNRITRVRWRFDDGSSVVQRMGGSARNRSMRTQRIAPTTTTKVVLEVLGSRRGPRNTIAVSEIRLASPAG